MIDRKPEFKFGDKVYGYQIKITHDFVVELLEKSFVVDRVCFDHMRGTYIYTYAVPIADMEPIDFHEGSLSLLPYEAKEKAEKAVNEMYKSHLKEVVANYNKYCDKYRISNRVELREKDGRKEVNN